jgi:hypothetical protein
MIPDPTHHRPPLSLAWVIPWPGLLVGGAFVAIGLASDPEVGFILAWLLIFCAAPLMMLAGILGAGSMSTAIGVGILFCLCIAPAVAALIAAWRTRDRRAWAVALNATTLTGGLLLGLYACLVRFSDAWPY